MRACEPCIYAGGELLGTYYQPDAEATAAVVLLAPMFEERRAAHRCMAELCSTLADRGLAALHIDLYGCGNSPGTLETATLDRWRQDVDGAYGLARERSGAAMIHLIGCRLGAVLAGWYAAERPDAASRLMLWSPVTSGKSYLSAARKRRMIQDSITDAEERPAVDEREVEGQVLSEELFDALSALDLTKLDRPRDARIFQCSFNDRLTIDVQKLQKAWGDDLPTECVVAQPFWNAHTPTGYAEIVDAAADLLIRNQ